MSVGAKGVGRLAVVVGLGLIGGSVALALKGFEDFEVVGVDIDADTLHLAKARGVGDRVTDDCAVLAEADVTFLCLHPAGTTAFLRAHRDDFRPGSLVTDVCGVKTAVLAAAECLPPEVDFIGAHPMAGKERGGLANAEAALFHGAHFIITPRADSAPQHIDLLGRMAGYMGFHDVVPTTAREHDALIAYTSQVMHIMAVAVCDDPNLFACKGFEGGSFRDCTRVADLDVALWTELFSMNAPALTTVIARLEEHLRAYRAALESGDTALLAQKLAHSAARKRRMKLE